MSKEVKEGNCESRGAQKARREHGLRKFPSSAKSTPHCGNDFQALKGAAKMFLFSPLAAKMAFGIKMGCKIPLWLRNDFAAP